ncbi:tetratricopeptide repeat protein [Rhodanobacter sp. UC4451_H18]
MAPRFSPVATLLLACAAVALCVGAYAPGLHGGFLFDDFGNLPALGANGPVDNWATFFRYVTSGTADPTGRPLALLSFLLDGHNWPASPYPFKRTNLLLHLANGIMLALLLRRLGRESLQPAQYGRSDLAGVLGAAFWLLHPLLVSTTLYIVQREAMLPVSFTLLGLLLWLHGRKTMLSGFHGRGFFWIAAGLGGCTVLGILSKANGILLPPLALVIEYVWLQRHSARYSAVSLAETKTAGPDITAHAKTYRRTMLLFGWLPSTFVIGYLVRAGWSGFVHGTAAVRPWTMGQRLLTEPRVLMEYLDLLWLPRPFTPGLFNDHFQTSTSLWHPITTLPALLTIVGLILGAWILRKKFTALALAILFYFVGQALESTTLQLELYFEHRNYLPAMLMFWPLALWLCNASIGRVEGKVGTLITPKVDAADTSIRKAPLANANAAKLVLATLILLGLGVMTHARAHLWGNTHDQALMWARLNPESPRAQANAALLEMAAKQPLQAINRLTEAVRNDPDQVQLSFNLIGAQCMLGRVPPGDIELARYSISHTGDPGALLVHWFDSSIKAATEGHCQGLTLDTLDKLLDAGLANQKLMKVDGRHQDLLYLKGHIALARHDPQSALQDFNEALDLDPRPGAVLNEAALLGSSGYPRKGLSHLDHYHATQKSQVSPSSGMPWLHDKVLQWQNYWPTEMDRLRATLQQDADMKAASNK